MYILDRIKINLMKKDKDNYLLRTEFRAAKNERLFTRVSIDFSRIVILSSAFRFHEKNV